MLFQKSYWLNVTEDVDVLPVIHDVKLALRESRVTEGIMIVYVPDARGSIIVAREGFDKEREFKNWLKEWTEAKKEAPQKSFFSYFLGTQVTLPIAKGGVILDPWHHYFLIDFDEKEGRRELRIAIFSETPKQEKKGRRGR